MNRRGAETQLAPGAALDGVAREVVDAAFCVHQQLGPGLLEGVYEVCLAHELSKRDLRFERQKTMPVVYDGVRIEAGLRLDLLVEGALVVEVKAVDAMLPLHKAQVLSYLRLGRYPLGLLINFNVSLIKDGIRRIGNSTAMPFVTPEFEL